MISRGFWNRPKHLGFEFYRCTEFSFFPFLAPTVYGSSDNHLIRLLFGPSILLLLTKFISSRLHQFQAKLILLKEWKLVLDVEHLNLDQVERELCYTGLHSMPAGRSYRRDLHLNSQEVSCI